MADDINDVIDLCDDSFILVNHNALADEYIVVDTDDSALIINIDDSSNEPGSPCETTAHTTALILQKDQGIKTLKTNSNQAPKNKNSIKGKKEIKKPELEKPPKAASALGECPICYDGLGEQPLASTKCGHVYCMKCIKKHLLLDKRCPTCRKNLNNASPYHPLYLNR